MTLGPARDEIHQEFLRAEKSLHAAEILLRDNCLEDAVSRAYYCNPPCSPRRPAR